MVMFGNVVRKKTSNVRFKPTAPCELYVAGVLPEPNHVKLPFAVTVVHLSTALVLRHTEASVPITV